MENEADPIITKPEIFPMKCTKCKNFKFYVTI